MNKNNKLLFSMVFFVSTGLNAATSHLYVGGGIGLSALQNFEKETKSPSAGPAGRVFGGYNFDEHFGFELNYSAFNKTQYHHLYTFGQSISDVTLNAVSLVVKGYIPLTQDGAFKLYGLIGPALVKYNLDRRSTWIFEDFVNTSTEFYSEIQWVTTAGMGVKYTVSPRFVTNIECSFFGTREEAEYHSIPQSVLATVGIAYKL